MSLFASLSQTHMICSGEQVSSSSDVLLQQQRDKVLLTSVTSPTNTLLLRAKNTANTPYCALNIQQITVLVHLTFAL